MKTKIILEIGCNHQGDFEIAKKIIEDAKKLNVWAIKFQKRDIASLPNKCIVRNLENSFGCNYCEHRANLEFSIEQIKDLNDYALTLGLNTMVTVFDIPSFLEMKDIFCNIKIPSQYYSDYTLNKELFDNAKKYRIFVSTGMHTLDEIINFQYFDKAYCTMYCRSIYPHSVKEALLKNAIMLKDNLVNSELGYSSHDKDGEAIKYMVLLGAMYIERHYTLDKNMKGSDHKTVSSNFEDMKKIIEDIEIMEENMKYINYTDLISDEEKRIRKVYRGF